MDAIAPGEHPLRGALLEGFDRAKAATREAFVKRAILAHGKVLTGAEWRIDLIRASDRGIGFEAPTVVLTLRHQEGNQEGATTLTTSLAGFQNLANVVEQISSLIRAQENHGSMSPPGSGSLEPPSGPAGS